MPTEFEFVQKVKKASLANRVASALVRVGIGDDCAVLPKNSKTDLAITADLLIEDIDFRLDWTTPEFVGHKALAVSLSDVAAMGATPVWSMLSIGIPEKIWKTDFVDKFYEGYFELARRFEVVLIGGDVSRTPDKIVVDSLVAGEIVKGKAVLRSGAKPGDLIFVSGDLGGAAGGLKLLESGIRYESAKDRRQRQLLLKQLQPLPRVSCGEFLRRNKLATAMIDLSDGLSGDLAHLCSASNVGARIFADKIPLVKSLKSVAATFDEQLALALDGGEDFELLFTIDPKKYFRAVNELKKRGFFRIGEITANAETIELISGGKSTVLQPRGFRHF